MMKKRYQSYFGCRMCRGVGHKVPKFARAYGGRAFEATGNMRNKRGSRVPVTNTYQRGKQYQFRCLGCGHVGWSSHQEVREKYEALR